MASPFTSGDTRQHVRTYRLTRTYVTTFSFERVRAFLRRKRAFPYRIYLKDYTLRPDFVSGADDTGPAELRLGEPLPGAAAGAYGKRIRSS